jgi:polyhydroxyalkanoate synthase
VEGALVDFRARLVHRYRRRRRGRTDRAPVLLVPPLAAPASCFDLRRGCSVAEHLIGLGYSTYLVDYLGVLTGRSGKTTT